MPVVTLLEPCRLLRLAHASQVGEDGGGRESGGCGGLSRIRPVRSGRHAPRPARLSQTKGRFPRLGKVSPWDFAAVSPGVACRTSEPLPFVAEKKDSTPNPTEAPSWGESGVLGLGLGGKAEDGGVAHSPSHPISGSGSGVGLHAAFSMLQFSLHGVSRS